MGLIGLAAMSWLAFPGIAAAQSAPDAGTGKTLYDANCASCHLESGMGGVKFGSVASADLRAPGLEQTYKNNDQLILRAILQAKDQDDTPLNPPMPAWSGRLTTAQAEDIIAYLHQLHS